MNYYEKRRQMVEEQIKMRGINDRKLINAMLKVPRHLFVPEKYRELAYADRPLPIGGEQTISQPYMVALMTQCLQIDKFDKVLEIGTGSGYQTAILAELANEVYTVERIVSLAVKAEEILKQLGYQNIYFKIGNGSLGWDEYAPYDKIIVTAASPELPQPLLEQLKEGGKIVIPIGGKYTQDLVKVEKGKSGLKKETICGCIFVPLIGKFGWKGVNGDA